MPLPVLPSKLVWERVRVEFNFADQLGFNETITSWNVEVFVNSGTDPAPKDMIATRRFQDGARLFQWVIGGVPGNIYRLVNTAVGSSGKIYKLEKVIAIVPSLFVFPPLFGVTFTTPPYPVESLDAFDANGIVSRGFVFFSPIEEIFATGSIDSGSLRAPLIVYEMLPEAFNSGATINGGTLVTPLKTYQMLPEGFNSNGVVVGGNLRVILVTYSNYFPEGFNANGVITGGSLA